MTGKYLYRDLGILALFLGAFYAAVTFVGQLDAIPENADVNVSQMSEARLEADVAAEDSNQNLLVENLLKMVEADPYNGHAWFRLGNAYFQQRFDMEYASMSVRGRAHDGRAQDRQRIVRALPLPIDASKLDAEKLRRKDLEEKVLYAQQHATEFARYRSDALLQIARIYGMQGNKQLALKALEKYYESDNSARGGLRSHIEFRSFRSDPVFRALVERDDDDWWSSQWRH